MPASPISKELADIAKGLVEAIVWLSRRPATLWIRIGGCILLIVLWQIMGTTLPRGFFATPAETGRALAQMLHDPERNYLHAIGDTLRIYLGGLGIAAVVGIPLGFLFGAFRTLGRSADPFLNALAATPLIALMPLVILGFGIGVGAKTLIVTIGALMPILINAYTGLKGADPRLTEMAVAYGLPKWKLWFMVLIPQSFRSVMGGMRLGATSGLVTAVIADLYMSMNGLGALLASYGNSFRMGHYFVVVLTLALIGVVTTAVLGLIERSLMRGQIQERNNL